MTIADTSRYFSELSQCAKALLSVEEQYLELGISSLFKKINYFAAAGLTRSTHLKLRDIATSLETAVAIDTTLRGVTSYAKSLVDYSSALCKVLDGLDAKANGKSYGAQEYKADLARKDRCRELCGETQTKVFR